MKSLILAASIAAAFAGPAIVQAAAQPDKPAMTRAQVQAKVQAMFAMVDANRDGAVTKPEFDAFRTKMQAEHETKRAERRGEMFGKLDANKDGQISRAEFAARPDHGPDGMGMRWGMRGPDGKDGPGKMGMWGHGRGERGPGHGMGGPGMGGPGMGGWGGPNGDKHAEGFFAALDANKDGRVTLAEASAKPLAMFDKADTNKDGSVTPEEHRAARAAMRAEWHAKKG